MQSYYSPEQFKNLNNQVARDRFQSTVEPSRRQFQEQVDRNVGNLSRSGIAFGGIGQKSMQDLYRDRFEGEANVASDIASGLAREGLGQAFQRNESELGRQYQGGEAALGRQFGSQQSELARQFGGQQAGLDRGFGAEQSSLNRSLGAMSSALRRGSDSSEAQRQREYATEIESKRRGASLAGEDTARQRQIDDLRLKAYQSGQTSSLDPDTLQRILGRSGQSIGTSQDMDIANRAAQAGVTPEQYENIRSQIGGAQLQDMRTRPGEYFTSPIEMDEYQSRLARIGSGNYDPLYEEQREVYFKQENPELAQQIYGRNPLSRDIDYNQVLPTAPISWRI